ncbi:MAG TPA: hypothetical protein VFW78_00205 [Bacteroidia bacterium]|nr:hypothetical protein [Bacteroidia bacterium]
MKTNNPHQPHRNQHSLKDAPKRPFENLVQETVQQLYSDERYRNYFESFTESSVHDFIAEYAVLKAWYTLNNGQIKARIERELFRFRDLATQGLWEIQQKKLFNLTAEWRAQLITLPGVVVSEELSMWEFAISKCPYLEPVSQSEFNLYLSYLSSGSYNHKTWAYNWQDYDAYRTCDPDNLPAWYHYFDKVTGTGYLLTMQDKQGELSRAAAAAFLQQEGSKPVKLPEDSKKPELPYTYESLHFFISTFESPNLLDCFMASEPKPDNNSKDASLQAAIRILQSAEQVVPVSASDNWKEGIIQAANRYMSERISVALRQVYDDYLFRLSKGIAPVCPDEDTEAFDSARAHAALARHRYEAGIKLLNS